jgi:hypothetical protein
LCKGGAVSSKLLTLGAAGAEGSSGKEVGGGFRGAGGRIIIANAIGPSQSGSSARAPPGWPSKTEP